jgi:hypothetical protein
MLARRRPDRTGQPATMAIVRSMVQYMAMVPMA